MFLAWPAAMQLIFFLMTSKLCKLSISLLNLNKVNKRTFSSKVCKLSFAPVVEFFLFRGIKNKSH